MGQKENAMNDSLGSLIWCNKLNSRKFAFVVWNLGIAEKYTYILENNTFQEDGFLKSTLNRFTCLPKIFYLQKGYQKSIDVKEGYHPSNCVAIYKGRMSPQN